ncbi:uncharacterized protein LOC131246718 [Magnolia sinica]|uniref:uncharacterized protein LOC131246718 n=1 Tax=Magnolia sinica TaxID=86752 RepID=UPI00265A3B71|nr:uncharacterized protein LOC131246718 [Magnolia sinica]
MDGSASGNPGLVGGGGICRRDDGSFIFAFSRDYRVGTNNRAELRVIYDGLLQCLDRVMTKVEVETESKVVAELLSGKPSTPYLWWPWVRQIANLGLRVSFQIWLIQREGNGPADGMAREGSKSQRDVDLNHLGELPPHVRACLP